MANIKMLPSTFLTNTPLIRVISEGEDQSHIVGANPHDQFILGDNGGLHYYNLQCCDSTGEFGGYKFDVKEPENDYELERYFDTVDFIDLMDIDAERFGLKDDERYIKIKAMIEKLFKIKMVEVEKEKQERIAKYIVEHFDNEEENYDV